MKYNLISTKSIISQYLEDMDGDEAPNEMLLRRIASDTISQLCYHEQMRNKVALIDVENYKAILPDNFGYIIQVLYRGEEDCKDYISRLDVIQWIGRKDDCEIEVNVNCPRCSRPIVECGGCEDGGKMIIDVDEIFNNTLPPYLFSGNAKHVVRGGGQMPFKTHVRRNKYNQFRLIRPSQHSFHNADKHVKGCLNLDRQLLSDEVVEYNLHNDTLILNREKGQILIAYFEYVTDDDGFRMMPDRIEYIEAVKWAIEEKLHYKAFRRSKNPNDQRLLAYAQQQKSIYFNKCRDLENIPDYNEFKAYWRNQFKIYPNFNSEYNFYKQTNDRYWSYFKNRR